jgi:hypothetical protein
MDEHNLVWHVSRAKFVFEDKAEYERWKGEKKVFFEMTPETSDDGGEAVFASPEASEQDFEVTDERGMISVSFGENGPVISAWVNVSADLVDDLDGDALSDWSSDQGGWHCATIHLGAFDAIISKGDGGDWRLAE